MPLPPFNKVDAASSKDMRWSAPARHTQHELTCSLWCIQSVRGTAAVAHDAKSANSTRGMRTFFSCASAIVPSRLASGESRDVVGLQKQVRELGKYVSATFSSIVCGQLATRLLMKQVWPQDASSKQDCRCSRPERCTRLQLNQFGRVLSCVILLAGIRAVSHLLQMRAAGVGTPQSVQLLPGRCRLLLSLSRDLGRRSLHKKRRSCSAIMAQHGEEQAKCGASAHDECQ